MRTVCTVVVTIEYANGSVAFRTWKGRTLGSIRLAARKHYARPARLSFGTPLYAIE